MNADYATSYRNAVEMAFALLDSMCEIMLFCMSQKVNMSSMNCIFPPTQ